MIPLTREVAGLIGEFAKGVENPGLRYEKFAYAKVWGESRKVDDAGRWNVLRLSTGGPRVLRTEARDLRRKADGPNVQPHNARRHRENADLLDRLAEVPAPDPAVADIAGRNTQQLLQSLESSFPNRVVTVTAALGGRLAINLAAGVIDNAGICLDRCFGFPFIPGSAVKGITRAWALWDVLEEKQMDLKKQKLEMALVLFGFGAQEMYGKGDYAWAAGRDVRNDARRLLKVAEFKGLVSFLPAYPAGQVDIVGDMVNPHHPNYYRAQGDIPALDEEQPRPNFFPGVERGSVFAFAGLINREFDGLPHPIADLCCQLRQWLVGAITGSGLGAKTAAGYGWFLDPEAVSLPSLSADRLRALAASPVAELQEREAERDPQGRQRDFNRRGSRTGARVAHLRPKLLPSSGDPTIDKWRGKLESTGNFVAVFPELVAIEDVVRLRRVFNSIFPEREIRNMRKKNPYWQSFSSRPQGRAILVKLGITLS